MEQTNARTVVGTCQDKYYFILEAIMAQIHEQTVVIRMSKLVKNSENAGVIGPDGFEQSVEAIVSELLGDESVIVEVERLD